MKLSTKWLSEYVNVPVGLKEFCDWVVGQDKDNSGYERSLSEMEKAGMFIRKQ